MPYFNEAGYEKQLGTDEGAHHARRYNEGALLLSLKSMITTLANLPPPSNFERLTKLHFRLVRERILRRCSLLCALRDAVAAAVLPGDIASSSSAAFSVESPSASPPMETQSSSPDEAGILLL